MTDDTNWPKLFQCSAAGRWANVTLEAPYSWIGLTLSIGHAEATFRIDRKFALLLAEQLQLAAACAEEDDEDEEDDGA